jgi:hypothetical protein
MLLTANKFLENVWKVQIFGNYSNKSELYSRRNEEQIKFDVYLPPFSSESVVLPSYI